MQDQLARQIFRHLLPFLMSLLSFMQIFHDNSTINKQTNINTILHILRLVLVHLSFASAPIAVAPKMIAAYKMHAFQIELEALGQSRQCIPPPRHVLPMSWYQSRHLANWFEICMKTPFWNALSPKSDGWHPKRPQTKTATTKTATHQNGQKSDKNGHNVIEQKM